MNAAHTPPGGPHCGYVHKHQRQGACFHGRNGHFTAQADTVERRYTDPELRARMSGS